MSLSNSHSRYGTVTKLFHWTTALLIFINIPLGLTASRMPLTNIDEIGRAFFLFSLHKTLGVTIFLVAALRIVWALAQVKPGALNPDRRFESWLAETVHWMLYGALVVVPLSGWVFHAALDGFAPIWWPFGQNLPFVPKNDAVAHFFGNLHWVTTKVLGIAILLHIAGALKHHFRDRDATLRRMWFGHSAAPQAGMHKMPLSAALAAVSVFGLAGLLAANLPKPSPPAATPALAVAATAIEWTVQSATLSISITQFGKPITGSFTELSADITFDPEAAPDFGEVTAFIAIPSLTLGSDTDQAMGPDFFDASQFPNAIFQASILGDGQNGYIAEGTLDLKGASTPIRMPFTLDLVGNVATAIGTVTINRRDFGIGAATDDATLSPDVVVTVNLTAQKT